MKRLRSSDDLDSFEETGFSKEWGRKEDDSSLHRSSSHRNFYYKSESGRKGSSSSSSRYDRLEDEQQSGRPLRKRSDYDVDYDRRKSYERYRDSNDRGILSSSPRGVYNADRIHRSESFSMPRREFPKGFRSERDRTRHEGSVSSWRRFIGSKDGDEGSRSAGDSLKASKTDSDGIGKVRSPQGLKDSKSPPWSRDSGSEQSKSIETKKSEYLPTENGGQSSEMEEGELEPDPQPESVTKSVPENPMSAGADNVQDECDNEVQGQNELPADQINSSEQLGDLCKLYATGEQLENEEAGIISTVDKEGGLAPDEEYPSELWRSRMRDKIDKAADSSAIEGHEDVKKTSNQDNKEKVASPQKMPLSDDEDGNCKNVNHVKVNNLDFVASTTGVGVDTAAPLATSLFISCSETQDLKGKGKTMAVPSCNNILEEDSLKVEAEPKDNVTCKYLEIEGPSSRGFELFVSHDVSKRREEKNSAQRKIKNDDLTLEPLELSLSLPNVLLPIGSHGTAHPPGSPSQTRSVQSFSTFRTNSDGVTLSMSFSGSQHYAHNPSCSLTNNSLDNLEQSVGSRPIFQGVDWQALSSNDLESKEVVKTQSALLNGNGLSSKSQASQGNSSRMAVTRQLKVVEGNSEIPIGMERQLSFSKHLSPSLSRHINDVRNPPQNVGSDYKDKTEATNEKGIASCRKSDTDAKDLHQAGGSEFVESILALIVSEPLSIGARRFHEMSAQNMAYLKDFASDIISSPSKQWQLSALKKALRSRSDISLESLLKCHRCQLEILVALKTGLKEFLFRNYDVSPSDLAEIYLNLRCRNLTCRNLLPVDECDCKICTEKNGFCSNCMCLVCSKFDMASNTCSWVGCDICLHWCHADCALRESFIRNGCSASGAQGAHVEMQFHCLACGHPSEMFGFVKEVFQNFADQWTAEALSKELEYVRKIFYASEDVKGKKLHDVAIQMLSKLAHKADLLEVKNYIMRFLTDADLVNDTNKPIETRKDHMNNKEGGKNIVGSSQGALAVKSLSSDKNPQLEKPAGFSLDLSCNLNDKITMKPELRTSVQKEPIFDELDSIIKIKQAEAKLFQGRADDARREAEALKSISVAKNERIEEEYTSRITKLRLAEAEEMRKEKFEELQALERAYQDYFNMKIRMERDIKDLLLKMEATRKNLAL